MYDVKPTSEFFLQNNLSSFQCLDEPVKLLGNLNTMIAQAFLFLFEKCDRSIRTTCKSDKEVNEWLKNKSISFVHNQSIFNSD